MATNTASQLMTGAGKDKQKQMLEILLNFGMQNPNDQNVFGMVMSGLQQYNQEDPQQQQLRDLIMQKESNAYLNGDDAALGRLTSLYDTGIESYLQPATGQNAELSVMPDESTGINADTIIANEAQNLYNTAVQSGNWSNYNTFRKKMQEQYNIGINEAGQHEVTPYKTNPLDSIDLTSLDPTGITRWLIPTQYEKDLNKRTGGGIWEKIQQRDKDVQNFWSNIFK